MKKTYKKPSLVVVECKTEAMLAGSGVSSGNGIGFGGVDTGGTQIPAAREIDDLIEQVQMMDMLTE